MLNNLHRNMMQNFEDEANKHKDVRLLLDSYHTLKTQQRWPDQFLEGYLSCIGDLIFTKK